VGARFAVSLSSGTAALHGAVFAAGLGPGDEAVTTPLTFCATANCVVYQGARPVFADVTSDTLNIDPADIASKVTSRTRAILPVDYAGHPADLDRIMEIADRRGLTVIQDACHSLGAEYHGRRIGTDSHMTVFSFHPVKHITTGEGGMVVTQSKVLANRLRRFRNHGINTDHHQRSREGSWHYEMIDLGYNYRLTDIHCALGLSQLGKLEANLSRRRAIAARYTAAFQSSPYVIPPAVRPDVNPAWHLYPVRLELSKLSTPKQEIFRALRAEGIGVNVHYIPVHLHPYYRDRFGLREGNYPVAEAAYDRLISLPMFATMTDRDVDDVIVAVNKVVGHFSASVEGL
jgi:perosamine synthetase